MSNAKHTPGPWIADEVEENGINHVRIHAGPFTLGPIANLKVCVGEVNRQGEHTVPNACLMSAAPDMLAALQAWQELRDSDGDDGRDSVEWIEKTEAMMRRAIAKATGK